MAGRREGVAKKAPAEGRSVAVGAGVGVGVIGGFGTATAYMTCSCIFVEGRGCTRGIDI